MYFPRVSFISAFLIWFFLLAAFALKFFQTSDIPKVSLTIDAELIGAIPQHQKSVTKPMKEKSEIKENSTGKKAEEEKIEPPSANSEKELKTESENKISTKLLPLYQPLPEIPDDLRQEAFDSFAVARFYISQNGIVTKVDLLTPCKNSKLNQLLLKSLYNWKFNPSIKPWTQDIRVTFKVE